VALPLTGRLVLKAAWCACRAPFCLGRRTPRLSRGARRAPSAGCASSTTTIQWP